MFFPAIENTGVGFQTRRPHPKILADVLRPLFELVGNGGFFHIQKDRECDYCTYNRVCGNERLDAKALADAQETMADNGDFAPLLDILNRWLGI